MQKHRYDTKARYYMVTIEERLGDIDTQSDRIIKSDHRTDAMRRADLLASSWYDEVPEKVDGWFVFEDRVAVRVDTVERISPVGFFKQHIIEPKPRKEGGDCGGSDRTESA